jgi:hypothetical protein
VPDDPNDPFATAALRGRVLDAWAASPARFREGGDGVEGGPGAARVDRVWHAG